MGRHSIFLLMGMSGSGKSVCLKHFEDMGYEVIRGLPVEFFENFLTSIKDSAIDRKIAIEIFNKPLILNKNCVLEVIEKNRRLGITVIFLDASNDSLALRYKESRRKHPLNEKSVIDGIKIEREQLSSVKDISDLRIDTSNITSYELKLILKKEVCGNTGETKVVVISFSYKNGVPIESDCVIDVRFLKNPYYDPNLKSLDGSQKEIQQYLKNDKTTMDFIEKTKEYIKFMLNLLNKEGRDLFYISFGCTGGFHRSVFVAESITEFLKSKSIDVSLLHRDLKIIK